MFKPLTLFIFLLMAISGKAQQSPNPVVAMNADQPIVCQLTDSAFAERKNALQKEVFSKVKSMEELPTGYAFHFEDDDQLLTSLFNYILAEKSCCAFFQQDVSIQPHQGGLVWTITGAEGVKDLLKEVVGEMELEKE